MTPLNRISSIHPRPEYIFTTDFTEARVAANRRPECKAVIMVNPRYTENIYEIFMAHLDELQEVYESLIDDESRRTFCGYWLGNISFQVNEVLHSKTSHYLTAGFIPAPGSIVIDCGACEGSTAKKFANLGCKVYGFELDGANFELARKLADKEGFVVEKFGLGSYNHETKFSRSEGNIGGSKLDENGTETAQIIKLDSYVGENNLPRVDFIKMDVEGAELNILQGAADTIARWKPVLALSAYHKWDDFWVLMNFVKSIRPDYEFALRQFAESREDVPFMFKEGQEDLLHSLGLEPNIRWFNECVLFAR